jgi:feruloyl-CoA synthase
MKPERGDKTAIVAREGRMAKASVRMGPSELVVQERPDGTLLIKSPHPLGDYPRTITDRLDHWAAAAPDRTFLAQRDAAGTWQRITYAGARALARNLAQALLDRGLSVERPLAILSGNGLEHAMIGLAAVYAGIPYAPVSAAYSLLTSDSSKLEGIVKLLTPGLVFATEASQFGRGIKAAVPDDIEVVLLNGTIEGRHTTPLTELMAAKATPAVDAANAKVGPDTVAKILFTSGSTGAPKGVINTQRMICSNQVMLQHSFPTFAEVPPVLVDWLPWSHTFGGNHNFYMVLMNGGTFWIDDGRPLPGAIEKTVENLREVSPTIYYNVPKGFEMLLPYLRAEPKLRETFFRDLQFLFYAGAALPAAVATEFEQMSEATVGSKIRMVTSLGSTETAPSALTVTDKASGPGVVGIPNLGVDFKLVPADGKLEGRLRGPNIMPGYWRQPELTKPAFDEEGFYLLGDAFLFADRADPEKGFLFDGRIAEDFKLATGTWVSVGPLRTRFVGALGPYLRDVVIAGHGRDDLSALAIPDLDACRTLVTDLDKSAPAASVLQHPKLRAELKARLTRLNVGVKGSSFRIPRMIVLETPPSIDKSEVTDKGSINQRAMLKTRADVVEQLYAKTLPAQVIVSE